MGSKSIRRATGRGIASIGSLATVVCFFLIVPTFAMANADDLAEMSLEDLMNIEVTSVSKKAQARTATAAAITVITAEDIRRGGFTHVPEALRTVPGLDIGQVAANLWSISVRGSNSLFANKLLVLIDGRTVYTPTFGGTYWDVQDYPIEDIERIEVIRGPGGTIWGANAVNGVINIITKNAKDTQGTLISGYGGNREAGLTTRFGGTAGAEDQTAYRVYARGIKTDDYDVNKDKDGHDAWRQGRLGFRADSTPTEEDTFRISGDFYIEDNEQRVLNPNFPPGGFLDAYYKQMGGNILGHWDHEISDTETLQVKSYYSIDKRQFLIQSITQTADLEVQHNSVPFENLSATVGGNYRFTNSEFNDDSAGIPTAFDPDNEDLHLVSAFGQLQYDAFDGKLALIVGTKLGYNSWNGFEYQPSGRFVVNAIEGHAFWGAVSRAVRSPTESERDITLSLPFQPPATPPINLNGNRGTREEELTAFELGYRFYAVDWVNADITVFWNEYHSVSSFEAPNPPIPPLELKFENEARLTTQGVEIEANVLPTDWWRVRMAYTYLHMDQFDKQGSLSFGKDSQQNPHHQFNIESFFDLPMGFEFDVSVYYVDGLPGVVPSLQPPNDNVEQYVRLDLRLGYQPTDWLELSLVGQNLNDKRHYESNDFTGGQSTQIPRSYYAKAVLNF
jgi:iron complex outermembrane receptor protein